MVKKAAGKTKHPAEILDDNGTLIAAARDSKGKAPAVKRDGAKP